MNRQEYMEILSGQIRCRQAVPLVIKELEVHIEEQKADFLAEGMPESEAEEMAVKEMGDPVEVGIWMDGIHRPKMNWGIILLIGLLSAAGLMAWYGLNIRAAGSAGQTAGSTGYLFIRYLAYTAAGFLAMVGICYMEYTWFAARAKKIMLVYCGVILFYLFFIDFGRLGDVFADGIRDAVWLMAFLFLPLYCGVLYSYRGQGILGFAKGAAWMIPIVVSQLIYRNRLEMLIFVFVLAVVLSYAVGTGTFCIPVKRTLLGIWTAAALLSAGIMGTDGLTSYGIIPEMYGDFMAHSQSMLREILAGSRALGSAGENMSIQGELLEVTEIFPVGSEFLLTYTAVHFGIFVSAVAILVTGALLLRLLLLSVKQKNRLGRLMGFGCGMMLLVHGAGYALGNMGVIMPEKVYCPFAMDRLGVIVTYVLFGIMLSIYRYQNISEAY